MFVQSVILIFVAVAMVKASQSFLEKAKFGSKFWYVPNAVFLLGGIGVWVTGLITAFRVAWWAPIPALLCTGVVMGLLNQG